MRIRKYKGAGIALFKKDQNGEYSILLGKRSINPDKGKWSIPGGGYEKKDGNLFTTAKREFREELGISLNDVLECEQQLFPVECKFSFPSRIFGVKIFEWITYMFEVDPSWNYFSHFSWEFDEVNFVPVKKLKKYKLAFGVRKEVRKFLKAKMA